jgi:hypothetical protein
LRLSFRETRRLPLCVSFLDVEGLELPQRKRSQDRNQVAVDYTRIAFVCFGPDVRLNGFQPLLQELTTVMRPDST